MSFWTHSPQVFFLENIAKYLNFVLVPDFSEINNNEIPDINKDEIPDINKDEIPEINNDGIKDTNNDGISIFHESLDPGSR